MSERERIPEQQEPLTPPKPGEEAPPARQTPEPTQVPPMPEKKEEDPKPAA